MFVRKIEDLIGSDKEVTLTDGGSVFQAVRLLTQEDGCGFSISDAHIGSRSLNAHYKNHVEANLIVSGQVELQDLSSEQSWALTAGMFLCCGSEGPSPLVCRWRGQPN